MLFHNAQSWGTRKGFPFFLLSILHIKKNGNYIPDGTNQGFCIFFLIWACRRGGGNHVTSAHAVQCLRAVGLSAPMPGSNDLVLGSFSLLVNFQSCATVPRQPFPLQSLTQARRTPHPFRGEQLAASSQRSPAPRLSSCAPFSPRLHCVSSGVIEILSLRDCSRKIIVYYFYQALAPNGAAQ